MDPDENRLRQHEASAQRESERRAAEGRRAKGEDPSAEEQPGVLNVVDAARDVQFPATIDDIRERAGERVVRTSKGGEWPLAVVLTKLKEDRFESIRDFQTAVQRHWEGIRYLEVPAEQRPPQGGANPQDPRTRG